MARCAGDGIIRSSAATRYQLDLWRQAGSVTAPLRASTPHGTCASAMKAACAAGRSAANDAANLSRSKNRTPPRGGRIGGTVAPGAGSATRVPTDSPWSGARQRMTHAAGRTLVLPATTAMSSPNPPLSDEAAEAIGRELQLTLVELIGLSLAGKQLQWTSYGREFATVHLHRSKLVEEFCAL